MHFNVLLNNAGLIKKSFKLTIKILTVVRPIIKDLAILPKVHTQNNAITINALLNTKDLNHKHTTNI